MTAFISMIDSSYFFQALPLIAAVSLIYAGTRFEDVPTIFKMGLRIFVWMFAFLAISYGVLAFFFSNL